MYFVFVDYGDVIGNGVDVGYVVGDGYGGCVDFGYDFVD